MLRRSRATSLFFSLVAVATPTAGCSSSATSPSQAATSVSDALRSVGAVEFYFLSRTEDWNYSPEEIVAKSTIRAYRSCGRNCHNFMQPVLDHLRTARPIKCTSGQEDALIRAKPGVQIVYSYSGQQIRVSGSCYFNEKGIRKVISGDSMLFSFSSALSGHGLSANSSFKPKLLRNSA